LGFLTSIFGDGESNIWTVVIALVIVLVLIVLGVWALKLVFKASGSISRGRQRRLAVIDTIVLDAKRSLILIRRDNVEHLIISNGGNDVVVESGIIVSAPKSNPPNPPNQSNQPHNPASAQSAPNGEQDAAAQRLGLSNILRRSKGANIKGANIRKEPRIAPSEAPVIRQRKPDQPSEETAATSLRHTGLLRPVSEMETVFPLEAQDNVAPSNRDSAMNDIQEVDTQAMVSVEEGANPVDVDARNKPRQEGKRPEEIKVPDAGEKTGPKNS